jgi:hypothetical protein
VGDLDTFVLFDIFAISRLDQRDKPVAPVSSFCLRQGSGNELAHQALSASPDVVRRVSD